MVGGEVLALLEAQTAEETAAAAAPEPEQDEESDIPLSPSVRRLIAENALDPSVIKGSGKDGRLTKTDVLDYLHKKNRSATPSTTSGTLTSSATRPLRQ